MQKKVLTFMEQHHMAEEGEGILAAVSGGADSICLLMVLSELQKEKKYRLFVVHVEHGIRGKDSREDAEFVENFCRKHKIPCKVYHCKADIYAREHKMTVEEGARVLRYQYFEEASREFKIDKIAVAHNQNDCAETMLFHLARGTGLKGLCGIPPVRENIIRPLLCIERREIEGYLKEQEQKYCIDKTNQELEYTRNRIRHQVLPVLSQINSQAISHMNQTAAMAVELEELLGELTEEAKKKYIRKDSGVVHIPEGILEEKAVIYKSLVHQIVAESAGSSRDISEVHVQQVLDLFDKQVGREIHLPYQLEAKRTYEGIVIKKITKEFMKDVVLEEWQVSLGETVKILEYGYEIRTRIIEGGLQNQEIPKKMYTKWFDYDKINGSMRLRTRREKDYLIIDAEGKKKKIKNYFIDEKVPREQRDELLLLADETHLIWAIGYRISEDVKVTEHTKRILEIQVDGGNIHE